MINILQTLASMVMATHTDEWPNETLKHDNKL